MGLGIASSIKAGHKEQDIGDRHIILLSSRL
jgi:hypothetical protein